MSKCVVADLRAVDVRSSHRFEEEIGAASSENGLFIAKIDFSVRTASIRTLKMVKIRADLNYLIGRSPAPTIKRLK
jgi:hypothetical protein